LDFYRLRIMPKKLIILKTLILNTQALPPFAKIFLNVYCPTTKIFIKKPDAQIEIKAPMLLVHELLTDIDAKMDYVPDIKNVSGVSKINRVNSFHTCVFDDLEIHFVTLSNENKSRELNYTEEANLSIGVEFISDYKIKESSSGTNLEVRMFPKPKVISNKSIIKKMFDGFKERIILMRIKSITKKNLVIFKNYCERIAIERRK